MSQVVLVTGASSGIGREIATTLLGHNYKVYGTSRNPERYADLPFTMLQLDLHKSESLKRAVADLVKLEGRIDVLVNNAGAGITGPLEETPMAESKKAFDTNFFGPMQLINTVLPVMRAQNSGCIINISSIAGYMGLPFRGIYSATKSALEIITEAYRIELAPYNIRICSVAPGDFATNIAAGRYHAPVIPGSPYAQTYGQTLALMDSHVARAPSPEPMAKKILEIIHDSSPRPHYAVGTWLQKFSIVLKAFLPQKVYERMLRNHYKL
ncbi:MAG TPA: short-chain dehydrogenase/reductase [Flavobacteriaceae bacterium]|nr:short-chain dehydrogenase/reductase [Flavobacteriaceae bacterium]